MTPLTAGLPMNAVTSGRPSAAANPVPTSASDPSGRFSRRERALVVKARQAFSVSPDAARLSEGLTACAGAFIARNSPSSEAAL